MAKDGKGNPKNFVGNLSEAFKRAGSLMADSLGLNKTSVPPTTQGPEKEAEISTPTTAPSTPEPSPRSPQPSIDTRLNNELTAEANRRRNVLPKRVAQELAIKDPRAAEEADVARRVLADQGRRVNSEPDDLTEQELRAIEGRRLFRQPATEAVTQSQLGAKAREARQATIIAQLQREEAQRAREADIQKRDEEAQRKVNADTRLLDAEIKLRELAQQTYISNRETRENAEIKQKFDIAHQELKDLNEQNKQVSERIEALNKKSSTQLTRTERIELTGLQAQQQRLQEAIKEASNDLKALETSVANRAAEQSALENQMKPIERLAMLNARQQTNLEQLEKADKTVAISKAKLEGLQKEAQRLQQTHANVTAEYNVATNEHKSATDTLNQIKEAQAAAKEKHNAQKREDNANLDAAVDTLKQANNRLKETQSVLATAENKLNTQHGEVIKAVNNANQAAAEAIEKISARNTAILTKASKDGRTARQELKLEAELKSYAEIKQAADNAKQQADQLSNSIASREEMIRNGSASVAVIDSLEDDRKRLEVVSYHSQQLAKAVRDKGRQIIRANADPESFNKFNQADSAARSAIEYEQDLKNAARQAFDNNKIALNEHSSAKESIEGLERKANNDKRAAVAEEKKLSDSRTNAEQTLEAAITRLNKATAEKETSDRIMANLEATDNIGKGPRRAEEIAQEELKSALQNRSAIAQSILQNEQERQKLTQEVANQRADRQSERNKEKREAAAEFDLGAIKGKDKARGERDALTLEAQKGAYGALSSAINPEDREKAESLKQKGDKALLDKMTTSKTKSALIDQAAKDDIDYGVSKGYAELDAIKKAGKDYLASLEKSPEIDKLLARKTPVLGGLLEDVKDLNQEGYKTEPTKPMKPPKPLRLSDILKTMGPLEVTKTISAEAPTRDQVVNHGTNLDFPDDAYNNSIKQVTKQDKTQQSSWTRVSNFFKKSKPEPKFDEYKPQKPIDLLTSHDQELQQLTQQSSNDSKRSNSSGISESQNKEAAKIATSLSLLQQAREALWHSSPQNKKPLIRTDSKGDIIVDSHTPPSTPKRTFGWPRNKGNRER